MEKNGMVLQGKQNDGLNPFITTSGERLLVATRQHGLILAYSLFITITLGVIFLLFASIFLFLLHSLILFIASSFVIIILILNAVLKNVVDWYFHLYIVTSRKIIDASYAPLFSHALNEVILEQVRCTEIDIQMGGVINEIIDMGDVMITFDRPTHQEEFVLANIKNPKKVGIFLGDVLDIMKRPQTEINWYRAKNKSHGFSFIEEIFPSKNPVIRGGFT